MRIRWNREEIILALDYYLQQRGEPFSHGDRGIDELSEILRALPYHPIEKRDSTFRNCNGIHMRLMNFRGLDPTYDGTGLPNAGKLAREVFEEFVDDPVRCHALAEGFRRHSGIS